MTIGLITEPVSYTRKYFLYRLLKLHTCEKIINPNNPFELVAEILPYSYRTIEKLSPIRLENLIHKKVKLLQKNGVTKFILSDFLYKLCMNKKINTTYFANGNGKQIFLALLPLCLRQTTKKAGIDLFSANVCIRDSKMDRISEYLTRELCYDTKNLYLCTHNLKTASTFCESFCDETGLWIGVRDKLNFHCDIILDVDNCQLKIGTDLFVRDVKFNFDFCGYNVCHTDIATLLTSHSLTPTSWVYSYEK